MRQRETLSLDTGVPWFGYVPDDWEVTRLGAVLRERNEKNEGTKTDNVLSVMKDIGVINYEDKGNVGNKKSEDIERYKVVHPGDLVLNSMNVIIGSVGLSPEYGSLSPVYYVLRTMGSGVNIRYYAYIFKMRSFQKSLKRIGNGILDHRMRIPMEKLKAEPLPKPPLEEQKAIVTYLDKKLEQIDTFIQNKRRLIELLEEQKTAVINKAVTQGLDSSVEMKDFGLPQVKPSPAYWEVRKLKFLGSTRYGLGQPPKELKGGLPIVRATNVERGRIAEKDMIFVDPKDVPKSRNAVLKQGEIIVVRSGAYTADSAIIPKEYEGAIAGYDMVFTPEKIDPNFIAFSLLSNYVLKDQLYLLRMRAAQPHLNKEELGETLVLIPSPREQKEIVEFIKVETKAVSEATDKARQEITLINEYRTTLISEVVTGKIDVRDSV